MSPGIIIHQQVNTTVHTENIACVYMNTIATSQKFLNPEIFKAVSSACINLVQNTEENCVILLQFLILVS